MTSDAEIKALRDRVESLHAGILSLMYARDDAERREAQDVLTALMSRWDVNGVNILDVMPRHGRQLVAQQSQ